MMPYSPDRDRKYALLRSFLPVIIMILLGACDGENGGTVPTVDVVANVKPIQVLVWDDARQVPLSRANVTLTIPNNVFPVKDTDNSGLAVFDVRDDLLSLTATFIIQKEGYQPQRHTVTLDSSPILTVYLVREEATPVSRATETATLVALPSLTAVPTATSTTIVPTAPTQTFTPGPTYTFTPTNTPTGISSSTPDAQEEISLIATALMSSSIFEQPDDNSIEYTFVDPGERVIVLIEQGSWIFVRNQDGVEGWAAANRFDITLGTPTPVPIIMGAAIQSASIFESPSSSAIEITFIDPGVQVRVLGRSYNSAWLFIRTVENVEGWMAASLIGLDVDVEILPIVDVIVQTAPSGSGTASLGSFSLDFWNLPGQAACAGGRWTITLFLEAHGGDAPYTYYVNNELVAGSAVGNVTKQFSGADSTSRIFEARVISSSGQVVAKEILVTPPDCD